MYFLLFIILLLALLICLTFLKPLEVYFILDSDKMNWQVSVTWLSIIKITVKPADLKPNVSVYILNLKVLSKPVRKSSKKANADITLLRALSLKDNQVEIFYGSNEPYMTGLICGALSSFGLLTGIRLKQFPDFISAEEYLRISANIEINFGETLINFIKLKLTKKEKMNRRKNMDQTNLNENVDTLFRSLENFTQNEGIIGKPVTFGDKTFLPVVSITVGYGGGNASMGKNQQANSSSMSKGAGASQSGTGALGLGSKLCTDAVILIDNQDVTLLPMNSNASTIMEKIPQIISGMGQNKQAGQAGQGQSQSQSQSQNQNANLTQSSL